MADAAIVRAKIEAVLSEILSDKHECVVRLKFGKEGVHNAKEDKETDRA